MRECTSTIGTNSIFTGSFYTNNRLFTTHDNTKYLVALLAFISNLADWQSGRSPRQPNQTKLVEFLEQVIQKLVSTAGRDWQHKFKAHKHIGLAILVKVQRIIAKFALVAGDPDVKEWNFDESPMVLEDNSDLQGTFHLMEFFLEDLHRAVIQQELFNFHEVPQLYTTLYPAAAATSNKGSDRNKNSDANASKQNGGRPGGGS